MVRNIHVWLWSVVAELEYILYPWKTTSPPNWVIERYNFHCDIKDDFEEHMYYNWLLSQEQKIQKIEENILVIYKKLEFVEKK